MPAGPVCLSRAVYLQIKERPKARKRNINVRRLFRYFTSRTEKRKQARVTFGQRGSSPSRAPHRAISEHPRDPCGTYKLLFLFFFFMSPDPPKYFVGFFLRFGNHDQSEPLYDPMSRAYYFIYFIIIFLSAADYTGLGSAVLRGFLYRGYLRSCKRFTIYFGPSLLSFTPRRRRRRIIFFFSLPSPTSIAVLFMLARGPSENRLITP